MNLPTFDEPPTQEQIQELIDKAEAGRAALFDEYHEKKRRWAEVSERYHGKLYEIEQLQWIMTLVKGRDSDSTSVS